MMVKNLHTNWGLLIVLELCRPLPKLVDNMSGNFNSIECESCTEINRWEECKKLIEGLIKCFQV